MNEINFLPIKEMVERVRSREISPVELVNAHLAQIERLNPKLNALVEVDTERVLKSAGEAGFAVMRRETLGSLHGIPVTIKSSISVQGMRWEAGSRLRSGLIAEHDAILVHRLKSAGAIVLGTTNTPEFLMAWETDNSLYGRTNNPWDLSRASGGSSGGEAAAIASGMSAGGVGSDGGGSIRVPAHFCGICGLKPTPGRIPSTGHFPISAGPFASIGVVGPMAREIGDLKILFEVMQGSDLGDTCASPVPLRWPESRELKRLKVGVFEDDGRTPVTAETRAAVRRGAEFLIEEGFVVEPFRPDGLEEARELWHKYFVVMGGMLIRRTFQGRDRDLSPTLRQFLQLSAAESPLTAETMLEAWMRRDLLRAKFLAQMQRYPILLCPAAAVPAFRHGERSWIIDGKTVEYLDAWSYTEFFNLLGNPSVVLPVSFTAEGLPTGVQIVGLPWQEETVLCVAQALERRTAGWKRPPIS